MLFLCHIRHSNPLKIHYERITKADRRIANDLNYQRITVELKRKIIFAIMYFVIKIIWFIIFMYLIKNVRIDNI